MKTVNLRIFFGEMPRRLGGENVNTYIGIREQLIV